MEKDILSANGSEKQEVTEYLEGVLSKLKVNQEKSKELVVSDSEGVIIKFKELTIERRFEIILEMLQLSNLKTEIFENNYKVKWSDLKHIEFFNLCDEVLYCNLSDYVDYFEADSLKLLNSIIKKKYRFKSTNTCGQCCKDLSARSFVCDGCLCWFDMDCMEVISGSQGFWYCNNCISLRNN